MITKPRIAALIGAAALLTVASPTHASGPKRTCGEFENLSIILEQNATDGDAEVVVLAKGQDNGLKSLTVVAPTGKVTAAFIGNPRGIGIREFILESAEPADIPAVLNSFPEGTYRFRGTSVNGDCLRGRATLSHVLAPTTAIVAPGKDEILAVDNFVVRWQPVDGAASYVIGIDNEDRGTTLLAEITPTANSFTVPSEWLEPGTAYTVSVAVKAGDGNVSSVEVAVSTVAE